MGNMFKCTLKSGSSGTGVKLTVQCLSLLAGEAITCTDGITTYTDTCPSSAPFEVIFDNLTEGTWTVSGGEYTQQVYISTDFEIGLGVMALNVTLYSAASDTVTFTDNSGARTVVTDTDGKAENVTIYAPEGISITFESSVAKDPDSPTSNYTKSIILDSSTTIVNVMPDHAMYWFGNFCEHIWGAKFIFNPTSTASYKVEGTNYIGVSKPATSSNSSGLWKYPNNEVTFSSATYTRAKTMYIAPSGSYTSNSGRYAMQTRKVSDNTRNQDVPEIQSVVANLTTASVNLNATSSYPEIAYTWGTAALSVNTYAAWLE